jgi:hypothetical protein
LLTINNVRQKVGPFPVTILDLNGVASGGVSQIVFNTNDIQ